MPTVEVPDLCLESLAVVVVDMIPYSLDHLSVDDMESIVSAQKDILQASVAAEVPIVALDLPSKGRTIEEIRKILEQGKHEYVSRAWNDGFDNSRLEEVLRGWSSQQLLFTGVSGPYCVQETASSGLQRGFQVITGKLLIAAQSYRQYLMPDCIEWFATNGTYISDHKQIVNILGKKASSIINK